MGEEAKIVINNFNVIIFSKNNGFDSRSKSSRRVDAKNLPEGPKTLYFLHYRFGQK